jgi:DNA-binding response OmpR family regulator
MRKKVLYVEDEPALGKIVKETLENKGFDVIWETDGKRVMKHFESFSPDICILDIMLPNIDGYSLCSDISGRYPDLPIIFLTAKVETCDLVKGFESGGSDYIRKPFSLEELIVRINNQFNLKSGSKKDQQITKSSVKIGQYTFFPFRYELCTVSETIKLSQREIEVLNIFVCNINKVIDRQKLLLSVWGDDSFFNSRNLDVYIRKIRQYFKEDSSIQIQTLKGKGYLFLVPADHSPEFDH